MLFGINEKEEVCANCKHFIQHYIKSCYTGVSACNAGHCIYPRMKVRKPGDTCIHFAFEYREDKYVG